MRKYLTYLTLLALSLCWIPHTSYGYVRSQGEKNKVFLYWNQLPAPFHINSAGSPNANKLLTYQAIQKGFSTWNAVTCSCFSFQYKGLTSSTVLGYDINHPNDNINLIIFQTKKWPHISNAVGVTSTIYNQNTGEIIAFDMELNNITYLFSINGKPIKNKSGFLQPTIDIQNTVTHEAGHALGLDHTLNFAATMYASAPPGETSKRTLHQDDINGLCAVYKKTTQGTCDIAVNQQDLKQGCQCHTEPHHYPDNTIIILSLLILFSFIRLYPK